MKKLAVFLGDIVIGAVTLVVALFVLSFVAWPFVSLYLSIDAGTVTGAWTYFLDDSTWAFFGNLGGLITTVAMVILAIGLILDNGGKILDYICDRLGVMMGLPSRLLVWAKSLRRPKASPVAADTEDLFDEDNL